MLWICHVLLRAHLGSKCKNRTRQSRWLSIPVREGKPRPQKSFWKAPGRNLHREAAFLCTPHVPAEGCGSATGSCCTTKFSQIREDIVDYPGTKGKDVCVVIVRGCGGPGEMQKTSKYVLMVGESGEEKGHRGPDP